MAARERAYFRAFRRVTTVVNSDAALKEVLDAIVRGTSRAMQAGVSLVLLDASREKLVHCCSWGLPRAYLQKGVLDARRSLAEVVTGQPVAISDVARDGRIQYSELAAKAGIVSMLGVPLVMKGMAVGSLRVYSRQRTEFSKQETNFVTAMANLAAVAIERDVQRQPGPPAGAQAGGALLRQARTAAFAHPSEEEFARILDFYNVEWIYEPRSFPLRWQGDVVTEMFTPDFYLPGFDLYVELTALKQSLVTEKNRKLRRLRELYPDVRITLLYKKDIHRLLAKYGFGPLAQARGRGVGRVLYSSVEIEQQVRKLAEQLSHDYADRHPVMVGVLRGVFCFMADLVRHMTIPVDVEFMAISYYGGATTASVKITKDMDLNAAGRHVIMVEDIVDTGLTLSYLLSHLMAKGPASVAVCALLDKRVRRIVNVPLDYIGFEVPDEFVVGYGLDYDEEYRNLPFIAILGSL
ncbi:MAG: hypoxanthine phosphoribosyltransferase [Chloroflexi bacterium]|nr:hypoxanthine phosphoribosyltransferase [Chloroflexota bacterium]